MLILAAVSVWVLLYAWMNRTLSKRTQVYADFGKHLIQETVMIFDFDQRLEYTARELGKTFKLRRCSSGRGRRLRAAHCFLWGGRRRVRWTSLR